MFAIIEAGGKQYKVAAEQKLRVEKLDQEVGSKVVFDKVFFIQDGTGSTKIGAPLLEGAKVEAEILREVKDKKVIIFKKRRRKNSRRKTGHRQTRTEIKILSIKA
jgi:large subunit ribosomal protein L21